MSRIASVVFVVLTATSATAFDFEEHKYISNVALRIAASDPQAHEDVCVRALEYASDDRAEAGESFGDLVSLADFVSDPNAFFKGSYGHADPEWKHLKTVKSDIFRWAQASHANENHFQHLALIAHHSNHQTAVGEASRHRWNRALLFEAYALHFLEDFLSPGHVATRRSGLPDFVAVGMHDRIGANGLDFRLTRDLHLLRLAREIGAGHRAVDFSSHKGSQFTLKRKDFAELADLVNREATIRLYGDSRLGTKPSRVQAALLTLLAVRSLLETLNPNPAETAFDDYRWDKEPRIIYGSYKVRWRTVTWYPPGEILIFGHENAYVPGRKSELPEGRWGLLAETLVLSVPPVEFEPRANVVYRYARALSPAIVAGAARTFGPEPTNAFYGRLIVTIPHTDLQFSGKAGVRRYEMRNGGHQTLPIVGFAFEGGFSFIFVRFGGEWERHDVTIAGQRDRLFLSTGISGFVPGRFVAQKVRRAFSRRVAE